MGSSTKHTAKIVIALSVTFFFLSVSASSADTIPSEEDINSLTKRAKLITDKFMKESFRIRMRYEYIGKFPNQDFKNNLQEIAQRAGNDLEEIAKNQRMLKQQIEDYEGDDWDAKYGSSGLWRKLARDVYRTTLSKCEIDLYLALTFERPQRNEILHKILATIDPLGKTYNTAHSQFLKARVLALLAQTEPGYKPLAKQEFDMLRIRSDMGHSTVFKIAIERIKLLGVTEPDELKTMAESIAQSKCKNDLELVLSLAFLQRRLNQPEAFEKTVSVWPQIKDFVGSIVLADLSHRFAQGQLAGQGLGRISVFEAELAALAAWSDETQDHKMLLESLLSVDKFQTALLLYVAAVKFAQISPVKAVNLLVKASKLQQKYKSGNLDIEAGKIAKQAAQLGYNLSAEDSVHCQLALEAFENYQTIANEEIDEELEYLYSSVLSNCGQIERGREVLQKIANRPAGNWRDRARLDLVVQALEQTQDENQRQKNELLEQLRDFILSCQGQDKNSNGLRAEAMTIYCQSLLESGDKLSAQKVLAILDEAETTRGIQFDLFKSKTLQQTGRLEESVHHMTLATRFDSGSLAGEVMELLSEVVDRIDELELQADDFNKMMRDCKKLTEFSNICFNDQRAGLFLAEISIFAADKEKSKLSEVEKLLNNLAREVTDEDVDLLRCRARLLTEQGEFYRAAQLWAKISEMRKSEAHSSKQRSWKWWRAKFYELYCWAKRPQTQKKKVLHTIEVLENSFTDIPPLWAEKLGWLKQQCQSQTINAGK